MQVDTAQRFLSLVPVEDFERSYAQDISGGNFFGFPLEPVLAAEERLVNVGARSIAYFSMEYGLSSNTYLPFHSQKTISDRNFSAEHHIFSNLRSIDFYVSVAAGPRLDLPIYSGGLGVLAGDTLKRA